MTYYGVKVRHGHGYITMLIDALFAFINAFCGLSIISESPRYRLLIDIIEMT